MVRQRLHLHIAGLACFNPIRPFEALGAGSPGRSATWSHPARTCLHRGGDTTVVDPQGPVPRWDRRSVFHDPAPPFLPGETGLPRLRGRGELDGIRVRGYGRPRAAV